jgi:hypothetical protein
MDDDQILDFWAAKGNAIVAKLKQVRQDTPVTAAIELLLGRIVGAGNSLRVLGEHAPHAFAFDGAMILRGIYDAMLQALYILVDAGRRTERAELYLDFFWIDKKNEIELFDKSPTVLGKRISTSPRRASVGPAIEEEIQRVHPRFENAKGKLRNHWYDGNLRDLAKAVELEAEYELLQKHLSGVVHSSAYALTEGMPMQGRLLMALAWRFSFRVLGSFAAYAQITLDDHEQELVRFSGENVFGDASTGRAG